MGNKFVVRSKKSDNYVITSLRIEKGLLDAFDELAGKSDYSRNELMCMALRFALENLEFMIIFVTSSSIVIQHKRYM